MMFFLSNSLKFCSFGVHLMSIGILFHDSIMNSIGERFLRVVRLNFLALIVRALSLLGSISSAMACVKSLLMNFHPYTPD